MTKKSIITILSIILIIYLTGFIIRSESINLAGIPDEEKSFYMDNESIPYMYELDSYYHYRLTKNFLEHGYIGNTFIDGLEWDSYSYYPPGVPMDYPPLLIYLTAFLYKLINLFSNIPLITVSFWLPAFFGPLGGIAVYLFVRRFSNDIAGLTAGILAVISPFYLIRTFPGWFDTDMFNLFFPVLVIWFFMESFHHKNMKMKVFYASISAFALFIFSMAWNGWQYIFFLIFFSTLFYIIWRYFKGKKIKDCLTVLTIFTGGSLALILILTGYINFLKPFYGLLELFNLMGNPWSPWPNLYINISELQKPSLKDIVLRLGFILLSTGILGCVLIFRTMINDKMKVEYLRKTSWFFFLFLILWIIVGFFSLLKGVRFIILIIPPLTISAGIGIGIMLEYLKNLSKNQRLIKTLYIFLVLIILIPQFLTSYDKINILKPGVNDDLWDASEWIKVNTNNNTVIITEWSYGHFLTAIAERSVTMDGRSAYIETLPVRKFYGDNLTFNGKIPNTSRVYWISKAFSTSNETLSLGIFKMLANSGDYAYLTLDNYTNNTTLSVQILNNILGIDKASAEEILIEKYNFNDKQVSNILNFSHPDEIRPFVILTDEGMTRNGKSTFDIGEWDFEKEKRSNFTYSVGNFNNSNSMINSTNDVIFNFKDGIVTWKSNIPFSLIEVRNNIFEKKYLNKKSNFSVILDYDNEKAVVIDKKFENSLFTRLVLEKSNTEHFESVYKNKKVVVWKIRD